MKSLEEVRIHLAKSVNLDSEFGCFASDPSYCHVRGDEWGDSGIMLMHDLGRHSTILSSPIKRRLSGPIAAP